MADSGGSSVRRPHRLWPGYTDNNGVDLMARTRSTQIRPHFIVADRAVGHTAHPLDWQTVGHWSEPAATANGTQLNRGMVPSSRTARQFFFLLANHSRASGVNSGAAMTSNNFPTTSKKPTSTGRLMAMIEPNALTGSGRLSVTPRQCSRPQLNRRDLYA